jgi:hypothetical protein
MNKVHIELLLRSTKGIVAVLEDLYKIEQVKEQEKRRDNIGKMEFMEVINVKLK